MKIVLAHDSFIQKGGAERLFCALAECYPDAEIVTLVRNSRFDTELRGRKVVTSFLQWFRVFRKNLKMALPFIPLACKAITIPPCDVLLSSSSAFAKGFQAPKNALHINYCHTPTRFLWTDKNYVNAETPKPLRLPIKVFLAWLKTWDIKAANHVQVFIANSREVQHRIHTYYNRSSTLIHPFVDTAFWHRTKEVQGFFLVAGRLHKHKNVDIVIKACIETQEPLVIAGEGRDVDRLKQLAHGHSHIRFIHSPSDESLRDLYSQARALVFPQKEDFGMIPLEAMACGTPVIAYAEGGALETIVPDKTGLFFNAQSTESLKHALGRFSTIQFDRNEIQKHAEGFSKEHFKTRITSFVTQTYENHRRHTKS